MVVEWKGYTPGSAAALAAARAYQAPAGMIEDVGYVARPTGWYPGEETEDVDYNFQPISTVTNGAAKTLPAAFNGEAAFLPGAETDGIAAGDFGGVKATPMGLPIVVAGAAMLTLGFLKKYLIKYGVKALTILIGAAGVKEVFDMMGIGAPDDTEIRVRKGGKRRYSIGSNPRVGTLQKVSRHCQRMLKRHEKVIREFLPKKVTRYGIPPARALSAIEKAAIRGT